MQSSHVTPGLNTSSKTFFHQQLKTLQGQPGPKTLGTSGNGELASWYEDAYAYYQQVATGQIPMPEQVHWQEFIKQMHWAYAQLMGSGQQAWDPMAGGTAAQGGTQTTPAEDPFGAMRGTNGNWVHNESKAEIGFIGNDQRDIWSNEIDLEVLPLSAQIEIIKTQDSSGQPPEEVLKIKVTDPATGTEAIYTIHDFEDAQIRIHVPDPQGQVQDNTGISPAIVETLELKNGSTLHQIPEASMEGVEMEDRDNALLYEGFGGEPVEFHLDGNGVAGDTQYHVVYGDAIIRTRPTDEVEVSQDSSGAMIVTVTHRDGSIDVVEVQAGYHSTLFAREETLSFDGVSYQDLDAIPEAFKESLSVNGQSGPGGDADFPEDTPPDRVENDVAYFNASGTVSLHNFYEGNEARHEITTGGVFELIAHNYDDRVRIYITPEGNYRILVDNPEFGETMEYFIKGPPEQILLEGFLPSQVDVYRSDSSNGFGGNIIYEFDKGQADYYSQDDEDDLARIQLDSSNAVQPGESNEAADEDNEYIQRVEHFLEVAGKTWEQFLSAIQAAGISSYTDVEDLKEVVRAGGFPSEIGPDHFEGNTFTMIRIIYNLDSEFSSAINGASHWDGDSLSSQYHKAAQRLQQLLSALYPGNNISLYLDQPDATNWRRNNEIVIDGQIYNLTNESKNNTNRLDVSEV